MATITLEGLLGASDNITDSFLSQIYPALADAILMPMSLLAIIYWAVHGYRIFAGYEPIKPSSLTAKAIMTSAIFASLNWSGFARIIYNAFANFMESAAATIMAGKSTATMIDALYNDIGNVAKFLLDVNSLQLGFILQGLGLLVINSILFAIALFFMTIAKFGLAATMVLLPTFLGFFFFEQTRQWAINWISMMLNLCLIYILVVAIVRIAFIAFGDAIAEVANAADPISTAQITIKQFSGLLTIEIALILFMLQVSKWASALSGGATVQTLSLLRNLKR
jgi:type IV secretion system protein VirB6